MSIRPAVSTSTTTPTLEGAGVHLHRAFGLSEPLAHDPFLLLDDFRNDNPEAYAGGFPWHPHRGIETITYVLKGSLEHNVDLSRFSAAPSARLSHFPFESDGAFPTQC